MQALTIIGLLLTNIMCLMLWFWDNNKRDSCLCFIIFNFGLLFSLVFYESPLDIIAVSVIDLCLLTFCITSLINKQQKKEHERLMKSNEKLLKIYTELITSNLNNLKEIKKVLKQRTEIKLNPETTKDKTTIH